MKIPFFIYPHVFTAQENEFLRVLKDVGSRGAFIMQQDLQKFEQRIAEYCGVKYAVGLANATDGLQLGLMAGGIEAGAEVIICSHTMIATASAVHFSGAIPVVPASRGAAPIAPVLFRCCSHCAHAVPVGWILLPSRFL